MNRTHGFVMNVGLVGCCLLGLPVSAEVVVEPAPRSPNFVIINIDDLGHGDIGPFGSTLNPTPHLDRMAREGRRFTSFYAAPSCTPSRAALLTGCYPKRALPMHGVLWPGDRRGLHPAERTIAEELRDAGYRTAMFGKWHLGDQPDFLPTRQGFEVFAGLPYSNDLGPAADGARSNYDEPLSAARPVSRVLPPIPIFEGERVVGRLGAAEQAQVLGDWTKRGVDFIRANRDRPFFLYFAPTAVHHPYYPSAPFRGKTANGSYGDWIAEMDDAVGRILTELRESGLACRTLVIATSDNGATVRGSNAPFRGHKHSSFEGGVRVPMIAWWPGTVPAGGETAALSGVMDIWPTLCTLAGRAIPTDRRIDGADLGPWLRGEPALAGPHDRYFYFRNFALEAVRAGPWKLFLQSGELFQLEEDVGETTDRAAGHPEVVARLRNIAAAMDGDLGSAGVGPGCRALGDVEPGPAWIAAGTAP
jgi:arylsulfatase A-like enzyme